jgi:LacI family transcriptional regulator
LQYQKNNRILLLINNSGAYDRGLLKGIVSYAKLHTSWIFLREAPYFKLRKNDRNIVQRIINWKPDGIIMCENDYSKKIISLKIPTIISCFTNIFPEVINIIADDYAIGEMGAQYFIDKKYKNFAYYGTNDSFWSIEREKAFIATLKKKGFNVSCFLSSVKSNNFAWESEPYHISDWLRKLSLPLAIMCCADDWSQLVVEAVKILNLKIPEDIAILGVDNDELICELSDPPLSSIKQDSEIVGFEAAYLLDQKIKKVKIPPTNIVGAPINVVARQSTDILAVNDVCLIKALNYINNNTFDKLLNVREVVNAVNTSRRVLEKKFHQQLGATIGNRIKQVRIDYICEKLLNTDKSVKEISYEMGFSSCTNFSSFFKKYKKVSPLIYRRMHAFTNNVEK